MVNTNKLKKEIEPKLIKGFCKKHRCEQLLLSKNELKSIFLGMEPDLVAYDKNKGILYIGEVTTSGYKGHKGNFHIGATRKFAECFSKFYLCTESRQEISKRMKPEYNFKKISCHLIVPEGSRFINALGYREKLLKTGVMFLDKIPLSKKPRGTMLKILENAKKEQQPKR